MKQEYTVYFEIYGKKMKAKIQAHSEQDAINVVRGKLRIVKVESILDTLKNMFGGL